MNKVEAVIRAQAKSAFKARNPHFFNNTHEKVIKSLERNLPPGQVLGAVDVRYPLSDPKPASNDPGSIQPHFTRESTDESRLNKTEKAYLHFLIASGHHWVGVQCISLKLGDDCRYNPDFLVINSLGFLELHEVKGFMREDALVKLKVVARMYRFFKVILVKKDRDSWSFQEVKP